MGLYFQVCFLASLVYIFKLILTSDTARIKGTLKDFIREKNLINNSNQKVQILDVELIKGGFRATLDIAGITDFATIEKHQDYLKQMFRASTIMMKNVAGKVILEVITQAITQRDFEQVELPNTSVLLGFNNKGENIILDMLKTPHLLISGLSGQGKTGMLKVIIQNLRGADIVLCNGFADDFKEFKKLKKLYGEDEILSFLQNLLEEKKWRERPLYVVLEELGTIKDKTLINLIKEFLCTARHYNIYVIGVIQIATKEELKFKSYFNSRVSFKQQDLSSYSVCLGCSVEKELGQQEFYVMHQGLEKGYTFTINLKKIRMTK